MFDEKVHSFVHTEGALREVHDAITDMMKQLANEPSVGLFFVQQHVHKAVPVMVSLKAQMVDNTQEAEYGTDDARDALNSVRSMKEVGPAVIGRMIKTIDSSFPRLPSLRPPKRDGLLKDSFTRTGETSDEQISTLRNPNFSSAEWSNADHAFSLSTSVDNQVHFDPTLTSRASSGQASVEKKISEPVGTNGGHTRYVRTMFDSAFQKASTVATVSKWNSYSKSNKVESSSSGLGADSQSKTISGSGTECNPSFHGRGIPETTYDRVSALGKTVSFPSTGASTSEENIAVPANVQEVQESLDLSLVRSVTDYNLPGQYVRSVLESALQVAGNVSKEGSKLLYGDRKNPSSVEDANKGWSWLQGPSKAFRTFGKRPGMPQSEEELTAKEPSGDTAVRDPPTISGSRQAGRILLEMESESYELLAAERAAKLEEWLQDTEEDPRKGT